MSLSQRMLDAADCLEEVSKLYDYMIPMSAQWSADDLRREYRYVSETEACEDD